MSRKPVVLLGSVASFVVALAAAGVGGCNIHELGHLATGWVLDVPVLDIIWCAPGNGRIVFAYQEPAFVGYSGGLLAALVLLGLYIVLVRPRLASPNWWAAGVAVLGTSISQSIVGVLEGSSPLRYEELQDNTFGLLLVLAGPLLAAAAMQMLLRRPIIRSG